MGVCATTLPVRRGRNIYRSFEAPKNDGVGWSCGRLGAGGEGRGAGGCSQIVGLASATRILVVIQTTIVVSLEPPIHARPMKGHDLEVDTHVMDGCALELHVFLSLSLF